MRIEKGALSAQDIASLENASSQEIEAVTHKLKSNSNTWAQLPLSEKVLLLQNTLDNTIAISEEWIKKDLENRARMPSSFDACTSVLAAPSMSLRLIHAYLKAFKKMNPSYKTKAFGKIRKNLTDQLAVSVYPLNLKERFLFPGFKAEVWLKAGIDEHKMQQDMAKAYSKANKNAGLALVLGAGNYAALTLADALARLYEDNQVVVIKTHPVTEYFGDILEQIFKPFIERNFVAIVHGDKNTGALLCQSPNVDSILITGSDKSFEHIVFGDGPAFKKNKLQNKPILDKRIDAELGNISPVIIVPGPWTAKELDYQARNIISSHAFNSGFSCNATRLLIQQRSWDQRLKLNSRIKFLLSQLDQEKAYYPGTKERIEQVLKHYPDSFISGTFSNDKVPWVFAEDIKANAEQLCFKSEIFGSFFAETALNSHSTIDFIEKAVAFCNASLWGNLNATLIVHPKTMKNKRYQLAIKRAVRHLKYGTVAINIWPGFSYYLGTAPWGAYPGNPYNDIQSGIGHVHNPFLFSDIEKSVLYAPFQIKPRPLSPFNPKSFKISKALMKYEGHPNTMNLLRLIWQAVF